VADTGTLLNREAADTNNNAAQEAQLRAAGVGLVNIVVAGVLAVLGL
jgi:hypothetical protein